MFDENFTVTQLGKINNGVEIIIIGDNDIRAAFKIYKRCFRKVRRILNTRLEELSLNLDIDVKITSNIIRYSDTILFTISVISYSKSIDSDRLFWWLIRI